MSEICFLHLGNSGIGLGNSYWNQILDDFQRSDQCQTLIKYPKRLFKETNHSHIPRALFIDSEDFAISDLNKSKYWRSFESLSLDLKCDSGNVYPSIKYTSSKNFLPELCEKIRVQAETCENLESFIICNGTGGGAGSGLAILLHRFIREEFPKSSIGSVLVFPCEEMGKTVIECYNSAHSVTNADSCSDFVLTYDNLALYEHHCQMFDSENPEIQEINQEFGRSLSNFTSYLQKTEEKVENFYRDVLKNPEQKIITPAFAPLFRNKRSPGDWNFSASTFPHCSLVRGLNKEFHYQGLVSVLEGPEKADLGVQKNISERFNSEIVKCFEYQSEDRQAGIYSVSDKTANLIAEIEEEYDLIYAKRAYVHWFVIHGMEEEEMTENRESLAQIREKYIINND